MWIIGRNKAPKGSFDNRSEFKQKNCEMNADNYFPTRPLSVSHVNHRICFTNFRPQITVNPSRIEENYITRTHISQFGFGDLLSKLHSGDIEFCSPFSLHLINNWLY